MNKFTNQLNNFCLKNKDYIWVISTIFLSLVILYACFQLFPFGANSIAHYDMYAQVVPLIDLIFDFFSGKASFSFSFFIGGGANTFGYLSYYIFSPFSIFLLMFGRANVLYAVNIVLILKLLTIGGVFCWFLKRNFKLKTLNIVLLSLLYTFSGYMFFSYTFITWLDLLIYIPLLAIAFMHLKNNGKIGWFSIILSLITINCFALGSFSLVFIFILLSIYCFLMTEKNERKTVVTKVVFSFAISLCISAIVLVPSFLQFLDSGRNSYGFNSILTQGTLDNFSSKLTTMITDWTLVFFSILFVVKCDKKKKFNQFLIIALLITFLPIIFDEVNLMLNFGSYYGYTLRFGFLNLFFEIIAMAFLMQEHQNSENTDLKSAKHQNQRVLDLSLLLGLLLIIVGIYVVFLFDDLSNALSNAQSSYYTLATYLLFALCFGLFLLAMILSLKKRYLSKTAFSSLLTVLIVVQVVINCSVFVGGGAKDINEISELSLITSGVSYDELDRFKEFNEVLGANHNLSLNVNAFTAFSSLIDNNLTLIGNNLGYFSTKNYVSSFGGTTLSDAILGYKYFISNEELNRPYLTLVNQEGDYYLYENSLTFPSAYTINNAVLNLNNELTLFEKQNAIFNYFGGVGDYLTSQNFALSMPNFEINLVNLTFLTDDENYYFNLIDENEEGVIEITYTAEAETILYLDFQQDLDKYFELNFKVNGNDYSNSRYISFVRDMGYLENGENVKIEISMSKSATINNFAFATSNLSKIETLCNDINNKAVNVDFTKNTITANFNNTTLDFILVVSNTYLKGWNATNNNTSTQVLNVGLGFVGVAVSSGENSITFSYSNNYILYGIIASAIGLLVAICLFILNKKIGELNWLKNSIYYIYTGFSFLLIAFFFAYPITICILKNIKII